MRTQSQAIFKKADSHPIFKYYLIIIIYEFSIYFNQFNFSDSGGEREKAGNEREVLNLSTILGVGGRGKGGREGGLEALLEGRKIL